MSARWLVVAAAVVAAPTRGDEGPRGGAEPTVSPAGEPVAADAGQDRLAVFVLQRGLYLGSDLGVFQTLGGTHGYSSPEPYVAVRLGYDLARDVSLQLGVAQGWASGNPISRYDQADGAGRRVGDYAMLLAGGEVVVALRPSERVAFEPRLGAGAAYVYPALTDPGDPSRALPGVCPYLVAGLDLKYLTLLTDFSAGAGITFYYVLGARIPAIAESLSVRYTF